jgi:hypothetical protein
MPTFQRPIVVHERGYSYASMMNSDNAGSKAFGVLLR